MLPYIKEAARPHLYMIDQPEISTHDRSIIADWIIEVHMHIGGLVPESLYLSIGIIDRFLSRQCVPRKRLQLLAITSLLIACKYEETRHISISEFTFFTDIMYTQQEILTMELLIVKILDYRLTVPTGYTFLQRFLHITKATGVAANLASFYMERILLEYSALHHKPSHLAAAAVSLALNNPDLPQNKLNKNFGYKRGHTIPGVVSTVRASVSPIDHSYMFMFLLCLSSPTNCSVIPGSH
jgi:hypothetical protein